MNGVGLGLVVTVAAALSAIIILTLLPLLHRYALAHPNARSSHRRATPQGAGFAVIVAALLVAAAATAAGLRDTPFEPTSLGLVFAAAVLTTFWRLASRSESRRRGQRSSRRRSSGARTPRSHSRK